MTAFEITVVVFLYLQGACITTFFWLWVTQELGEKLPNNSEWFICPFWPLGVILLIFGTLKR